MCGISGIISSGHDLAPLILKMTAAQTHRGPDAQEIFLSPCKTCALGHNRLSIIDLANHANQPMADHTGRYHIVFNGEIYNYRELRALLPEYLYRTNSDTEVILAAWDKWGNECVQHFIGMFSFAIWDNVEQKLTAFRDRLGIKPFHYYFDGTKFIFASEIKSILAAGISAKANIETWAEYLNHGLYDHLPSTFFENILSLNPGHMLEIQDKQLTISPYWELKDHLEQNFTGSFEEAQDKYLEILTNSIRLRLRSDVPLGLNLSGGLDSSSLLAMVDKISEDSGYLESFTVSFKDTKYDEEDFANSVPVQKKWNRTFARIDSQELWDGIDTLMFHQEAPFGGIGTLSYSALFKEIQRRNVTVVLEGQGVDECLGGYKYYQNIQNQNAGIYQDGTSFLHPECISEYIKKIEHTEIKLLISSKISPLNNALYQDVRYNKLPRVLRMNDRLSMAYSKELREPFLDHRLVEFCFSLPDDYKIRNGQGKFLLRKAMERMLPQSILDSQKRAVVTPQREWMCSVYKDYVLQLLNSQSFKEMGLFNVKESIQAFDDFCSGNAENGFFIWQWINASAWSKAFKIQF